MDLSDIEMYVITLEKNSERLEWFMENSHPDIRDKVNIFYGIDGSKIDTFIFKNKSNILNTLLPKGLFGCHFSHLDVWNNFLKTDKEYILVFEDDTTLDKEGYKKFIDNFDNIKKILDQDLLLCFFTLGGLYFGYSLSEYQNIYKCPEIYATNCYILNRSLLKNLAEKVYNNNLLSSIDSIILYELLKMNKIIHYFPIGIQRKYESTLCGNNTKTILKWVYNIDTFRYQLLKYSTIRINNIELNHYLIILISILLVIIFICIFVNWYLLFTILFFIIGILLWDVVENFYVF